MLVGAHTGEVVDKCAPVQTVEGSGIGYNIGTVPLDTAWSGSS